VYRKEEEGEQEEEQESKDGVHLPEAIRSKQKCLGERDTVSGAAPRIL
jgi:hypothetical protein